jgi:rod shape-determining protein MreC
VKKTEPAAAKKAEKSEHAKKAEPARKAASGVAP